MPGTVEVVCGTTHALMYLVNLDTLEVQFLRENHMGAVTQVRTIYFTVHFTPTSLRHNRSTRHETVNQVPVGSITGRIARAT